MVKKRRTNNNTSSAIVVTEQAGGNDARQESISPIPGISRIESLNADVASVFHSGTTAGTESPTPSEGSDEKRDKVPIFKDPSFVHSNKSGQAATKKTRVWKNLKQIIVAERMASTSTEVTYASLEAPPSFKPAKKYSDISGLPAKYTDPQTKIRFATVEEYSRIRMLPVDLVSGYLALRKANLPVP